MTAPHTTAELAEELADEASYEVQEAAEKLEVVASKLERLRNDDAQRSGRNVRRLIKALDDFDPTAR